jgi:hypothetical protein
VDETPEREASAKVAQHLAAAVQVAEAIFRLRLRELTQARAERDTRIARAPWGAAAASCRTDRGGAATGETAAGLKQPVAHGLTVESAATLMGIDSGPSQERGPTVAAVFARWARYQPG